MPASIGSSELRCSFESEGSGDCHKGLPQALEANKARSAYRISKSRRGRSRRFSLIFGNRPFGGRQHPNFSRLLPEGGAVVDPQSGLRLPLVYHLVQQRVLHLGPTMPGNMSATDGQLDRASGADVHRELAQSTLHPAGQPDRDFPEPALEMLLVELAMPRLQPMQQKHVTGTAPLTHRCRPRRCVFIDRELEKLTLGHSPESPGNPRIQKSDDGL